MIIQVRPNLCKQGHWTFRITPEWHIGASSMIWNWGALRMFSQVFCRFPLRSPCTYMMVDFKHCRRPCFQFYFFGYFGRLRDIPKIPTIVRDIQDCPESKTAESLTKWRWKYVSFLDSDFQISPNHICLISLNRRWSVSMKTLTMSSFWLRAASIPHPRVVSRTKIRWNLYHGWGISWCDGVALETTPLWTWMMYAELEDASTSGYGVSLNCVMRPTYGYLATPSPASRCLWFSRLSCCFQLHCKVASRETCLAVHLGTCRESAWNRTRPHSNLPLS